MTGAMIGSGAYSADRFGKAGEDNGRPVSAPGMRQIARNSSVRDFQREPPFAASVERIQLFYVSYPSL